MNPDTKFNIEEMQKQFTAQTSILDKQFADQDLKWEQRISDVEAHQQHRADDLEATAVAIKELSTRGSGTAYGRRMLQSKG